MKILGAPLLRPVSLAIRGLLASVKAPDDSGRESKRGDEVGYARDQAQALAETSELHQLSMRSMSSRSSQTAFTSSCSTVTRSPSQANSSAVIL